MTAVKNPRQCVELDILVLQCRSREQYSRLRQERRICTKSDTRYVVFDGISCVQRHGCHVTTRVQRHRDGASFVSVANDQRTHADARIQFCTRCPGRLLSMSSRCESLETGIRISSHGHSIKSVSWVCGVGVWTRSWASWRTSFPNTLIGVGQKLRMRCGDLSSFHFRCQLFQTFRWSCRVDLKHFI